MEEREKLWEKTDEEMQEIFSLLRQDIFNIEDKKFYIPDLNKKLTYRQLLEKVNNGSPDYTYVKPIIEYFVNLKNIYDNAYSRIDAFMDRFVVTLQEKDQIIEDLKQKPDKDQDKYKELKKEIEEIKRALETQNEEAEKKEKPKNVKEFV